MQWFQIVLNLVCILLNALFSPSRCRNNWISCSSIVCWTVRLRLVHIRRPCISAVSDNMICGFNDRAMANLSCNVRGCKMIYDLSIYILNYPWLRKLDYFSIIMYKTSPIFETHDLVFNWNRIICPLSDLAASSKAIYAVTNMEGNWWICARYHAWYLLK